MVDPTPLLKVFGAAADVAGQIATDKAINGRRNSKGSTATDATRSLSAQSSSARADYLRNDVDITDGQLIFEYDLADEGTGYIPHELGRKPVGAIVVFQNSGESMYCGFIDSSSIGIKTDTGFATAGTVTIWIF